MSRRSLFEGHFLELLRSVAVVGETHLEEVTLCKQPLPEDGHEDGTESPVSPKLCLINELKQFLATQTASTALMQQSLQSSVPQQATVNLTSNPQMCADQTTTNRTVCVSSSPPARISETFVGAASSGSVHSGESTPATGTASTVGIQPGAEKGNRRRSRQIIKSEGSMVSKESRTPLGNLKAALGDVVKHAIFFQYSKAIQPNKSSVLLKSRSNEHAVFSDFALAKGWKNNKSPGSVDCIPNRVSMCVLSRRFDIFCALAIILNAVILGLATDKSASSQNPDEVPSTYVVFNTMFALWFLIELCLRLYAVGLCDYIFSSHWRWNLFDALVVSIDVFESICVVFSLQDGNSALQNITAVRILRVFRIARAIRVVRLIRFCKDLRLIVMSLLRSGPSLFWCVIMLVIIIYVFSIYLMQNVVVYLYERRNSPSTRDMRLLQDKFGTLTSSCYTLFQAISGGVSWHEVSDPLLEVHWTNGLVFCFYVFFTMFAMLNIITGIFVESAMNSAQSDYDEVIAEEMHNENSTLQQLKRLFMDVDKEQTGYFTFEEFGMSLLDRRVRAKLKILGIDIHEAEGIFRLLDLGGNHRVSIEEFVYGCMRIKGGAKSLDVATLLFEHKRMADKWGEFFGFVKKAFSRHEEFDLRLEKLLMKAISIPEAEQHSVRSSTVVAM